MHRRFSTWTLTLVLSATLGCGRIRFEDVGRDARDATSSPDATSEPADAASDAQEGLDADETDAQAGEAPVDATLDEDAATDAEPSDAADALVDACPPEGCPSLRPVLHWRLDEDAGVIALDQSPNAFHGSYVGEDASLPSASTAVPSVQFADPLSRAFVRAERHAVRYPKMPAGLKPTLAFTLAIWYRATTVDLRGSELISGSNHYLLRVYADGLDFSKRVQDDAGAGLWTRCTPTLASTLDGAWHHVAGVNSESGMHLYFDGKEVCANDDGRPLRYDLSGTDFWVGRHGNLDVNFDFEGNLDDARYYDRALTAAEIAALAAGAEY